MTPLRFQPLFRRYVWGGQRLGTLLNKPIGAETCAESWEIVDHGADQSVVAAGPLAGKSLQQLLREHGSEIFGKQPVPAQFPLLFKFLDANQVLSVQVHPNDAQGAALTPPDLGKTEAWLVLHAEPGSVIYAGLKRGFDRHAFEREIARGACELCLHKIEPRVGDCIFIPAGTVHALGAGLVIAELQQASDTTFRLFDWNRVGADGHPRPLHLEQGLAVTDYARGPVLPQVPETTLQPGVERLVACDKFVWDRHTFSGSSTFGGDGRFHLLAVVSGEVALAGDPAQTPLKMGETALLPATAGAVAVSGSAVVLDAYLP